jgi:hypothetical protein
MKRLTPLAAIAATTAALAFSVPATSAEAATPTPAPALVSGSLPCQLLVSQIRLAVAFRFNGLATVLSNVFIRSGCGGAAI